MKYKLVVVDDEIMILDLIKDHFETEGYLVYTAANAEEALKQISIKPDAILLDINMPGMDGIGLCKQIRSFVPCPILFLTARIEDSDKVEGFQAGADDYVVKPFSLEELTARVSAHIRREQRMSQSVEVRFFNDLVIHYTERNVYYKKKNMEFSKKEFDIIELLSLHPRQVFGRESIYVKIWGLEAEGDNMVVKEHIHRIRLKLKECEQEYIETVWGVGYRWKD